MGDKRVSGEESLSNYLQPKARYQNHENFQLVINTSTHENELVENFAMRVKNIFVNKFSELTNPKIISLLGVSADGHTAGIFPLDKESFTETYGANTTYVPVHLERLTIDSRASFTPIWILEQSDEVIGFITGQSKKITLSELINTDKQLHEQPAQILKIHPLSTLYTDLGTEDLI